MLLFFIIVSFLWTTPVFADNFILNEDGSVADLATGLVWQGRSEQTTSALDAVSLCANMNIRAPQDWRLPTLGELATLEARLTTLAPARFWATQQRSSKGGVYCFGDGAFFPTLDVSTAALVRCVRTDPLTPVLKAVNQWAESWRRGDVEGYLSAYQPDYQPNTGVEHDVWLKQRRQRLHSAQDVKIEINTEKMTAVSAKTVEFVFLQHFQAQHYHDLVRKRLVLNHDQGHWLIAREEQLSQLPAQTFSSASAAYE